MIYSDVLMINPTCQIGESSGYQPIIVTSADQLGMVEEEVTTEIIKSEIQVGTAISNGSVRSINISRLMMTAATFKLRTRVSSTRMDWT